MNEQHELKLKEREALFDEAFEIMRDAMKRVAAIKEKLRERDLDE